VLGRVTDAGERAASGSYFCRFKAGDFAAMRKMVLANEECKVCLVNFIEKEKKSITYESLRFNDSGNAILYDWLRWRRRSATS